MTSHIELIIRIIIAIALAILFGNGSVVAFNRVSAKWFEDYIDDATKVLPPKLVEVDNARRQRLPSTPWKYIFTIYFLLAGIYLATRDESISYEISVLCVLLVVLLMSISDALYQIVPDQFSLALAALSIGFINYHDKLWEPLAGAGAGLIISLFVLGIGFLICKAASIGGADIKFFASMGLIVGRRGIIIIYILTTLIFAIWSAARILRRQGSLNESLPMIPPACVAVTIYFLFLWNMGDVLVINL